MFISKNEKISTICVIGNSPNVLEEELGEKIDSCDVVIRIQAFKIKSFEKYIGSKTSVIALSWVTKEKMSDALENCGVNDFMSIEYWSSRPLENFRLKVCQDVLGHIDVKNPSHRAWQHLVNEIYSSFWRKQPGSGIVVLEMALETFPQSQIFFCGFDSTKEKHHLGSDRVDRETPTNRIGHDWIGEWNYIQKLTKNGIIKHIRDKN
ncbi:hypothetical protein CL614_08745 [archaeon]|nr:hypothetical protein [archaeon]|tara:strand:- start:6 stop:626 length:621 start_codon:yes stop_codon:yes gene_type:complete